MLGIFATVVLAAFAVRAASAGVHAALGSLSTVFTAVTAGLSRFEVLNAAGLSITAKLSKVLEPAVLDNTTAPRYRFNMASPPDDIGIDYNVKVDGQLDQVLQLSLKPDAAFTADTSDSTVLLRLQAAIRNDQGGWDMVPKDLRLADRITPDGANSTRAHPLGLADDGTIAAATWGPYLRFAPGPNEVWYLEDYQRADFHNSA